MTQGALRLNVDSLQVETFPTKGVLGECGCCGKRAVLEDGYCDACGPVEAVEDFRPQTAA